jgi:hypothetical protein
MGKSTSLWRAPDITRLMMQVVAPWEMVSNACAAAQLPSSDDTGELRLHIWLRNTTTLLLWNIGLER